MVLNRGLYTPWLLCRSLGVRYSDYMRSIYLRPLLAALPVLALVAALKVELPGRNWLELAAAATTSVAAYFGLAFLFCFDREHRRLVVRRLRAVFSLPPG
jgi:hypothetical protein